MRPTAACWSHRCSPRSSMSNTSSKPPAIPLLFLLVMSESSGVPVPGETGADHRRRARQPGQAENRARDRAGGGGGDRRRQHRLRDRAQGRTLAAGAPGRVPAPAPGGAARRRAVLRTPRPQGRVLRALRARPARVGLVAGRRHAHALALVRAVERARRHHLGDRHRPDRLLARPLRRQRRRSLRPLRPGRRPDRDRSSSRAPPPQPCSHRAPRSTAPHLRHDPGQRAVGDTPSSQAERLSSRGAGCRERSAPTCPPAGSARSRRSARRNAPGRPPGG